MVQTLPLSCHLTVLAMYSGNPVKCCITYAGTLQQVDHYPGNSWAISSRISKVSVQLPMLLVGALQPYGVNATESYGNFTTILR